MLITLNTLVRKGLYRFKKFIENEEERQIAAEWALSALGFPDMDERTTAKWMETYEPHVVKFINSTRGYAQTGIKKIMWENWGISVNKAIMDKSWFPKILKRELDMENDMDYTVFKFWVTEILPKAVGYAGGWGENKFLFLEIQKAFNPKNPKDQAVTTSTEAIAAWFIENNYEAWPAQWEAKEKRPRLKMEKHYNGPDKKAIEVEDSYVSIFYVLFALNFFGIWPLTLPFCPLLWYPRLRWTRHRRSSTAMARNFLPSGRRPQLVSQASPVSLRRAKQCTRSSLLWPKKGAPRPV